MLLMTINLAIMQVFVKECIVNQSSCLLLQNATRVLLYEVKE